MTFDRYVYKPQQENTISEYAVDLLCHIAGTTPDGRTFGLSYDVILEKIRSRFPDAETSLSCLRWYVAKIKDPLSMGGTYASKTIHDLPQHRAYSNSPRMCLLPSKDLRLASTA